MNSEEKISQKLDLSLERWRKIHQKLHELNKSNERETIPYLEDTLNTFRELNSTPERCREIFAQDPGFQKYFIEQFLVSSAKNIILTNNFIYDDVLELANNVIAEMINFFIVTFDEGNTKITEVFKTIMDPSKQYYKLNDQFRASGNQAPIYIQQKAKEEHAAFAEKLKEGDIVDALKIDTRSKSYWWSRAKIVTIYNECYMRISYLNDCVGERNVEHYELAPLGTKSLDFEWRLGLKKGDLLDILDKNEKYGIWYRGIVLNTFLYQDRDVDVPYVKVGYRQYDEKGDKTDVVGRYFGWGSNDDEEISVMSTRILPLGTMAKKILYSTMNHKEDDTVDDLQDLLQTWDENKFGVVRIPEFRSLFLMKLIDKIGVNGIFDKILNRISDTQNWCPIDLLQSLLEGLGNIHGMLLKNFCYNYIPKLKEAVINNIIKSPDSNLRNFTKEKIESISRNMGALLKRVVSFDEKCDIIEKFELNTALLCFNSDFLEKKLLGLKIIMDIIKSIRIRQMKVMLLNSYNMNKWIQDHKIFEKLYGVHGHIQLIQRSSELLKFLLTEKYLNNDHLHILWSSTQRGDMESKICIYKVFNEISQLLNYEHAEFLLDRIKDIKVSEIVTEDIELIYEITRFSTKGSEFIQKSCNILLNVITKPQETSTVVQESAIERFCDLSRSWEFREQRLPLLVHMISVLEEGVSVNSIFKIMRKTIEYFNYTNSSYDSLTKSEVINQLCSSGLITSLIKSFKHLKSSLRQKMVESGASDIPESTLDSWIPGSSTYIEELSSKLDFIHYLISNSNNARLIIDLSTMIEIYDEGVLNFLSYKEREAAFRFFKEVVDKSFLSKMEFDDVEKFFIEKLNKQSTFGSFTADAFQTYKMFFAFINDKYGKIKKCEAEFQGSTHNYPSISTSYGTTHFSSSSYSEKVYEFEYQSRVPPEEIWNIQSLWDLIFSSRNSEVSTQAIEFLINLYLYVTESFIDDEILRQSLLKKVFTLLEDNIKETNSDSITKCLKILKCLLDETEKLGVGKQKSHSAILAGETLTLNFDNDMSYYSDSRRRFTNKFQNNITIFELRILIAKEINTTWDKIKLVRSNKIDIRDQDNGRTISEMRLRNNETLTIKKRSTPEIPKAALLLSDGSLNPLLAKIFKDLFQKYSVDQKLNHENLAKFMNSCTNQRLSADEDKVKEIMKIWDDDHDNYLTENNFLAFYQDACKNKPKAVWDNLSAHFYRNDLKKISEIEAEEVKESILPRYMIISKVQYISLIMRLLDSGVERVSIEAWELLSRLPTSQEIFQDIVSLNSIKGKENQNWDSILGVTSNYRLMYSLQIIEYLMEYEEPKEVKKEDAKENKKEEPKENRKEETIESKKEETIESTKEETIESKKEEPLSNESGPSQIPKSWKADFTALGGFEQLYKIFITFSGKNMQMMDILDKKILSVLLKIFKTFLTAVFASSVENIYRTCYLLSISDANVDDVAEYLYNEGLVLQQEVTEAENKENEKKFLDKVLNQSQSNQGILDMKESIEITMQGDEIEAKEIPLPPVPKFFAKITRGQKIEETAEFKIMKENLSGGLGEHILQSFDMKSLLSALAKFILELINELEDFESEDRIIIELSLTLTISIMLFNSELTPEFLSNPSTREFIIKGVFCGKSFSIRKIFSCSIFLLCHQSLRLHSTTKVNKMIIKILLDNIPKSSGQSEEWRSSCSEYYELLSIVLEDTFKERVTETNDENWLNFEELLTEAVHTIRGHRSSEKRNNTITDRVLVGLLQLVEKILTIKPNLRDYITTNENFLQELFHNCLFEVNADEFIIKDFFKTTTENEITRLNYVKCKGDESRNLAYKLLLLLSRNSQKNLKIMINECLVPLLNRIEIPPIWNYIPGNNARSPFGYTGIRNLGCICYMNAMLQQFYMNPTFRYGLLLADDKVERNIVKREKDSVDDNLLHQLQRMFGFLEFTDRQEYNPSSFCFSFKDFSGDPVNVTIQQDAQEFLNIIFDKLENTLKPTALRQILPGVYGGRTCSQLICSQCKNISSREEQFYNLSLEVKNLKNIYESFERFVTGEIISGYRCSNCNQEVDTTKRSCLSSLPNVLIIHLQRFVFNLDSLMNEKLNTRLEFPFSLDLEPYTKESLEKRESEKNSESANPVDEAQKQAQRPKEYYTYKLTGVVVHMGTSEFGHYYSFINTQQDQRAKGGEFPVERWFEFNDSIIRDFDIKNMESECYGGGYGDYSDWGMGRDGAKSAYILVYERELKESLKLDVSNLDPLTKTRLEKSLEINIDEELERKNALLRKTSKEAQKDDPIEEAPAQEVVDLKDTKNEEKMVEPKKELEVPVAKEIEVDYYRFSQFLPDDLFREVWSDNHKYMFERHIYNKQFFSFLLTIIDSVELPYVGPEDFARGYIEQSISDDQRKEIINIINLLKKIILDLIARAMENQIITEYFAKLERLLIMVPEQCLPILLELSSGKHFIDFTLSCPDTQVRGNFCKLLLRLINTTIYFRKFDLQLDKYDSLSWEEKESQEEYKLLNFLNYFFSLIHTEVPKNWVKFMQYFEFWKLFAASGKSQLSYLFAKETIAIYIDFFLDKKSPLENMTDNKYQMGNKQTNPNFDPLIQTVGYLVQFVQPNNQIQGQDYPYVLSENDRKCIFCAEFYEKALRDNYDSLSISAIIQHFAYNNPSFSFSLSYTILKGLHRSTPDEAKPFINAAIYLLLIEDSLTRTRMEWLLGYPQPISMSTTQGVENYGSYGIKDLDDQYLKFVSTLNLEGSSSILNILVHNRKKLENLCFVCLRGLLELMNKCDHVLDYICQMPSAYFIYAKYDDWFKEFILTYISEARRYYHVDLMKEEAGKQALEIMEKVEVKVQQKLEEEKRLKELRQEENRLKSLKEAEEGGEEGTAEVPLGKVEETSDRPEEKFKNKVLEGFYDQYIMGMTAKEDIILEKSFPDNDELSLSMKEIYSFVIKSLPNGKTNLSFPSSVVNNNFIFRSYVELSSPISFFIETTSYSSQSESVFDRMLNRQAFKNLLVSIPGMLKFPFSRPKEPAQKEQQKIESQQSAEEEKQKVPLDETMKRLGLQVQPCIKRVYFQNKKCESFLVRVNIEPKSPAGFKNMIPIESTIMALVKPYSHVHILSLMKLVPEEPWDEFEVKCVFSPVKREKNYEYEEYLKSVETGFSITSPREIDDPNYLDCNLYDNCGLRDDSVNPEVSSDKEEDFQLNEDLSEL